MKIVYTGGTFDLIHSGHVNFLRTCAKFGEVYVALNSDEFVEHYKGKRPIMSFDERFNILSELKCVRSIIKHECLESSIPTIENSVSTFSKIYPNFIIVGDDWAKKDYYKQMGFTQEWLNEKKITLCYVPYTKGISTTELKERILNDSSINADKK